MKRFFLLIAAALLFCGQMNAQEFALATNNDITLAANTDISAQLNPAYNLQTNIFSTPTLDLNTNNSFGIQDNSSPKFWGISCIVSGGLTMTSGIGILLWSSMFNKVTSSAAEQGFETDPEFDQAAGTVTKVFKIAGIAGTALGAALIGTGILILSNNKDSKGGKSKSSHRPVKRKHRRYSDNLLAPEDISDWTLTLNAGPAGGGLTFTF